MYQGSTGEFKRKIGDNKKGYQYPQILELYSFLSEHFRRNRLTKEQNNQDLCQPTELRRHQAEFLDPVAEKNDEENDDERGGVGAEDKNPDDERRHSEHDVVIFLDYGHAENEPGQDKAKGNDQIQIAARQK